jgi:hypothetical protein
MKSRLFTVLLLASLAAALLLSGCSAPGNSAPPAQPPADSQPEDAANTEDGAEEPAAAITPANFTVIVGETSVATDAAGGKILRVDYEFINKGDTAVPSAVSAAAAAQGGKELTAATIDGAGGSVDYMVRSGGSVQCFAAFQLESSEPVQFEIRNISVTPAVAVAAAEMPVE